MADCQISAISDQCGPSTSKDLSTIPEGRVGQGMHFLCLFFSDMICNHFRFLWKVACELALLCTVCFILISPIFFYQAFFLTTIVDQKTKLIRPKSSALFAICLAFTTKWYGNLLSSQFSWDNIISLFSCTFATCWLFMLFYRNGARIFLYVRIVCFECFSICLASISATRTNAALVSDAFPHGEAAQCACVTDWEGQWLRVSVRKCHFTAFNPW